MIKCRIQNNLIAYLKDKRKYLGYCVIKYVFLYLTNSKIFLFFT